jgi:hypothetical protein
LASRFASPAMQTGSYVKAQLAQLSRAFSLDLVNSWPGAPSCTEIAQSFFYSYKCALNGESYDSRASPLMFESASKNRQLLITIP